MFNDLSSIFVFYFFKNNLGFDIQKGKCICMCVCVCVCEWFTNICIRPAVLMH